MRNRFRYKVLFLSPMKLVIVLIFLFSLFLGEFSLAASLTKSKISFIKNTNEIPDFKRIKFDSRHAASFSPSPGGSWGEAFHNDSIHRFNFRYKDKKRGIKPFIAPALLIGAGTVLLISPNANENFQNWAQDNFAYSGHADDYLQYAPGLAVYALNLFGVKGKNNFGNRTAIVIKSLLINDLMVSSMKTWVNAERPNGEPRSFPSGHTSVAFAMAHFMHKEFGEKSVWYSIGAYTCASTVGLMRVAKNAHWISDVMAGAGFGILSTELVYLTHLYKWDKEHIKNLDIFPWRSNRQTGLTMVYTF